MGIESASTSLAMAAVACVLAPAAAAQSEDIALAAEAAGGWGALSVVMTLAMFLGGVLVAGAVALFFIVRAQRRAQDAALVGLPGDAADRGLFASDRRERALVDLPLKYGSKNFRLYLDDHMSGIIDQDSVFATADPKIARAMLMGRKHAAVRNRRYTVARNLPYNDGILFMQGDVWKRHHSAMLPVLQGPNFGAFAGRMFEATKREVATWPDGATVDLVEAMRRVARVILFEAGFGIDVTLAPTPEASALFAAVTKYDEKKAFATPDVSVIEAGLRGLWRTWRDGKAVERALGVLLEARKRDSKKTGQFLRLPLDASAASAARDAAESALLKGEVADGEDRKDTGSGAGGAAQTKASAAGDAEKGLTTDFLTRFVEAGMPLKEIACAVTHLKGAHRAIAVMTALAVMELAKERDWQERVRAELEGVVSAAGTGFITRGDTSSCPVTMAVLRETTRRHAISLGVMRTTAEPLTVPVGEGTDSAREVTIPEGQTVLLLLHAVHHHPDFWDEPEKFDPGRWLVAERSPEGAETFSPRNNFKPRVPFSYIPFLEGVRQCLGRKLVELEFATMLHAVLQAVEPELPKDYVYKIKADFYPVAERPLQLVVRRRKRDGDSH